MKKFCEMTELELLDTFGFGYFTNDEIKDPTLFKQVDTKDITGELTYWLTSDENSGCLCVGSVKRNGITYYVSIEWKYDYRHTID